MASRTSLVSEGDAMATRETVEIKLILLSIEAVVGAGLSTDHIGSVEKHRAQVKVELCRQGTWG